MGGRGPGEGGGEGEGSHQKNDDKNVKHYWQKGATLPRGPATGEHPGMREGCKSLRTEKRKQQSEIAIGY